jgi:hypothetical protein
MIHEDDSIKQDSPTDNSTEKSDLTNNNPVEDLSHNAADPDNSQEYNGSNMDNNWINIKTNGKDFLYIT